MKLKFSDMVLESVVCVPYVLMSKGGLKPDEALVLCHLKAIGSDRIKIRWVRVDDMAMWMGMTTRKANAILKRLEKAGWIQETGRDDASKRYMMTGGAQ